jgi:hypothetical protein
MKKAILNRSLIVPLFLIQFIPIVIFTPESYAVTTQEWWLPILLAILSIFATVQILVRHNPEAWPWYLLSFSQGFNIISRLMMVMPHTTKIVDKVQVFNTPYVLMAVFSVAISWFFLWYLEQPEIRMGAMREAK